MDTSRKMVVLTPVKNEAWILPLFLQSASIWADYIIIADQSSTDGSREIASRFPKVVLIKNDSADLDEEYRNRILIEKARELVGTTGILFRLDADELFTPNFQSTEWEKIKRSEKGTIWRFRWIQLYKKLSSCWEMPGWTIYGAFVDDGRAYASHGLIHNRDQFKSDRKCYAKEICVLHFQFVDWNRMQSKHRWYQCFERINFPNKSATEIYRLYHWMYLPQNTYKKIPNEWIETYEKRYDICLRNYKEDKHYWWDDMVQGYFSKYTPQFFRRIETCKPQELPNTGEKSFPDKLLLFYLRKTTTIYNNKGSIMYFILKSTDYALKHLFRI